jgi:transketolase
MDDSSLKKLASLIRYYIVTITTRAGSGHLTSSLSAVELMTTLFFKYLRYDLTNPKNAGNDRVIFSKGHATPPITRCMRQQVFYRKKT